MHHTYPSLLLHSTIVSTFLIDSHHPLVLMLYCFRGVLSNADPVRFKGHYLHRAAFWMISKPDFGHGLDSLCLTLRRFVLFGGDRFWIRNRADEMPHFMVKRGEGLIEPSLASTSFGVCRLRRLRYWFWATDPWHAINCRFLLVCGGC